MVVRRISQNHPGTQSSNYGAKKLVEIEIATDLTHGICNNLTVGCSWRKYGTRSGGISVSSRMHSSDSLHPLVTPNPGEMSG
jgi:hypothetical protein